MNSDPARWAALVESGIFLVSGLPGLRRPPFKGLQFRSFPVRDPLANIVGAARLAGNDAAATVARVRNYFAARGQPFSWRVGPASAPGDLDRHLLAAGLRPAFTMRGMAMPEITVPVRPTGPFIVRDARHDDAPALAALIAQSYPTSSGLASRLAALYLQPAASGRVHVVVAEAPDSAVLAGMGVCYDFADCPVTVLAGAATQPALRDRGVYAQILGHRLRAARERGAHSAVMQAVTDTSAPICRRAGFIDLCELQVFEFDPGRPDAAGAR